MVGGRATRVARFAVGTAAVVALAVWLGFLGLKTESAKREMRRRAAILIATDGFAAKDSAEDVIRYFERELAVDCRVRVLEASEVRVGRPNVRVVVPGNGRNFVYLWVNGSSAAYEHICGEPRGSRTSSVWRSPEEVAASLGADCPVVVVSFPE